MTVQNRSLRTMTGFRPRARSRSTCVSRDGDVRAMASALLVVAIAAAGLTGCSLSSTRGPAAPTAAPAVSGIGPSPASIGDTVTISGTGFTSTANAITFGIGYLHGVASADGASLRFALPAALTPCPPSAQVCVALAVLLTPGAYQVSVVNANGSSNGMPLQVVAR
jgi:hypothetical protein